MIQVPATVLSTPMEVYNFAVNNNGKVIFVTEDEEPSLQGLPNRLEASILLPPYESIAAELDGNYQQAELLYGQWLYTKECMDYINLITLAIMEGIPTALYFGPQFEEMKFPFSLIKFFQINTGIAFGYDMVCGMMDEQFIPINLSNFLVTEIINIPTFFSMMPVGYDILPAAISYLAESLRPPLKPGSSLVQMNEYFKDIIAQIHKYGKYLHNPIKAGTLS